MGQTGAQGKGLQLGQGGEGGVVLDLWGGKRVGVIKEVEVIGKVRGMVRMWKSAAEVDSVGMGARVLKPVKLVWG